MIRNRYDLRKVHSSVGDENRVTWNRFKYYQMMYYSVYNRMVEAGVARRSDTKMWFDVDGNRVEENSPERFGQGTHHVITDPEWILFVDETGANTNMKKDGRIGRSQYIVGKNQIETSRKGAAQDLHFTTLLFQAATGEPVMVAVVLKSNREHASLLPVTTTAGYDISVPVREGANDAETIEMNLSKGGAMEGGPICSFRGKEIPTFVSCSPNASITSQILADMLAFIDNIGIYEREENKIPFLLLDGHHSRLEPPFLDYINNEATEWYCCIGVPYGSHHWQLADSSQCNGAYKTAIAKFKQRIYDMKPEGRKSWRDSDVIPIVKHAFRESFAKVDSVKKAPAHRGWNPINWALLTNPDILATKERESWDEMECASSRTTTSTAATIPNVNLQTGKGASLLNDIIEQEKTNEIRMKGIQEKRKRLMEEAEKMDSIRLKGRITSGKLASQGHFQLDNKVREAVKEKIQLQMQEEQKKKQKRELEEEKRRERYAASKEKEAAGSSTLTMADKRIICRYERMPTDPTTTTINTMNAARLNQLYDEIVARRPTQEAAV